jgi:hypothetical protein
MHTRTCTVCCRGAAHGVITLSYAIRLEARGNEALVNHADDCSHQHDRVNPSAALLSVRCLFEGQMLLFDECNVLRLPAHGTDAGARYSAGRDVEPTQIWCSHFTYSKNT